jgi:hypothetical protein
MIGIHWINFAWNRDRWRDVVNVVKNLQVPYNTENLLSR